MRKELLLYVPSMEQGEEASVISVANNRKYCLITSPQGQKFSVSLAELKEALESIQKFNSENHNTEVQEEVKAMEMTVEYGVG